MRLVIGQLVKAEGDKTVVLGNDNSIKQTQAVSLLVQGVISRDENSIVIGVNSKLTIRMQITHHQLKLHCGRYR